jgi:hypothetical protein
MKEKSDENSAKNSGTFNVYRPYCDSLHKTRYYFGAFLEKEDAELMISQFDITASGPGYGVQELKVYKKIGKKMKKGGDQNG